jgi:hypothetical protein
MTHWSTGSTAVGLGLLAIPDVPLGLAITFFGGGPVVATKAIIALNIVGGGLFLFGRSGWGDQWGHDEFVSRGPMGNLVEVIADECNPFDPSPTRRCRIFDF